MPKSKTIEIDEILTPENSGDEFRRNQPNRAASSSASRPSDNHTPDTNGAGMGSADPFAHFRQSLPWKARLTLWITQWFMLLRNKSWSKLVTIPIIILAVVITIPLGLIAILLLALRSIFKPSRY